MYELVHIHVFPRSIHKKDKKQWHCSSNKHCSSQTSVSKYHTAIKKKRSRTTATEVQDEPGASGTDRRCYEINKFMLGCVVSGLVKVYWKGTDMLITSQ